MKNNKKLLNKTNKHLYFKIYNNNKILLNVSTIEIFILKKFNFSKINCQFNNINFLIQKKLIFFLFKHKISMKTLLYLLKNTKFLPNLIKKNLLIKLIFERKKESGFNY